MNHISHRRAGSRAEIQSEIFFLRFQHCERAHMRIGQIGHMNIVANRGSIGRRIIGPIKIERGPKPLRRGDRQRNQMRFRRVIFAQGSAGVRARRIEIAQRGRTQPESFAIPAQHLLDEQFRFAIRIHGTLRMRFRDGDRFGIAVNCCRGGKNDPVNARIHHRVQQIERYPPRYYEKICPDSTRIRPRRYQPAK